MRNDTTLTEPWSYSQKEHSPLLYLSLLPPEKRKSQVKQKGPGPQSEMKIPYIEKH